MDRDGTINVDHGYVHQKEFFEFIEGVPEGLKLLQDEGFMLIIITNQSGIARGYYGEEDFEIVTNHMLTLLEDNGVQIAGVYHCPHLEDCECRKPKLKLFYDAQKQFSIDFSQSYAIGDNMRDLAICKAEPVKGILINNSDVVDSNQDVCKTLLDAAWLIKKNKKK